MTDIVADVIDPSVNITLDILFSGLKWGVLLPAAVFLTLSAVDAAGNRLKHIAYQIFAIAFAAGVLVWLSFFVRPFIPGSITMTRFALAFVMSAVVFILNFMKLSPIDYAVMFVFFACMNSLEMTWTFGVALQVLYIFITLLTICKIRFGRLHGRLFHVWFASMLVSAELYICGILFDYVRKIGYSFVSQPLKLFVWGVAMSVAIVVNLALIYIIKRLFRNAFDDINQMGKAYPRVERLFVYTTIAILLFISLAHFGHSLYSRFNYLVSSLEMGELRLAIIDSYNNSVEGLFNLFILFALGIQLSFLIMLFRTTRLKDNLRSKMLESQSLAAYSSGLERNLEDIRNIKHDIKNIFLTMSGFVERSGDAEMQAYYHDKIFPFANDEIAKSDLYGKLVVIDSEQLKAFLFYKISQVVELGIALDLDISQRFTASGVPIEIVDLARILGIILDNAIEECMGIAHGVIIVRLSQNEELTAYTIKNTVNPETRERGIKSGVSSKGEGRGKGLVIAQGILEKYDCVTLNSYFQEDMFIQSLVIYAT